MEKIKKSDEEWKKILSEEAYQVTRKKGTERPFSGEYVETKEPGVYKCVACGSELFSSRDKFDSGTGWPSFTAPINDENVETRPDYSFLMKRIEAVCASCDAHLGHLFEDGPPPSGMRYCINSVALRFERKEAA